MVAEVSRPCSRSKRLSRFVQITGRRMAKRSELTLHSLPLAGAHQRRESGREWALPRFVVLRHQVRKTYDGVFEL